MYSKSIEKLIKLFSKFPTVGPRTASRFVFYLIKKPADEIKELTETIEELKSKIKICSLCFKSFEPENSEELCSICADTRRNKEVLCVVENEIDLETVEKTRQFKGLYFILGGVLPVLKKENEQKTLEANVEKLCDRIKITHEVKETILALNPTPEGKNTALWLKRKLEGAGVKISELGRGLPLGGEIEYADEETIAAAFESRK
ncbi:MAG: recombination mediator RecR [Patescibacteria group bacterium]|nr:recombination mediator RecR [Patescibacteria group bacterium]